MTADRPRNFVRSLDEPDELIELETVRSAQVNIAGLTVAYDTQAPGWRWSTHVRPLVGGDWCEARHVGVMLTGRLGVRMRDGTEFVMGPMDVMDLPPGHDAWVIGDEPVTTIGWTGARNWLGPVESLNERVLATLVITDIVDSTGTAVRIGDRGWSDLLANYEFRAGDVLPRYRGRLIKLTGDGLLALFDGAARAARCALALRAMATDLGIVTRAAVHTGEVELAGTDIHGITVHEATRMLQLADPGEIVASATTAELGRDGATFEDRGEHELRGLPGTRRIYRIR